MKIYYERTLKFFYEHFHQFFSIINNCSAVEIER
jgi:hypothetical protein